MRALFGSTLRAAGGTAVAAGAGMLTRPCCLGPALLSITGSSAAGLGQLFSTHHTEFAVLSGALLTASIWMNVRWQSQAWNKWVAALSTIGAFTFMARGFWL